MFRLQNSKVENETSMQEVITTFNYCYGTRFMRVLKFAPDSTPVYDDNDGLITHYEPIQRMIGLNSKNVGVNVNALNKINDDILRHLYQLMFNIFLLNVDGQKIERSDQNIWPEITHYCALEFVQDYDICMYIDRDSCNLKKISEYSSEECVSIKCDNNGNLSLWKL